MTFKQKDEQQRKYTQYRSKKKRKKIRNPSQLGKKNCWATYAAVMLKAIKIAAFLLMMTTFGFYYGIPYTILNSVGKHLNGFTSFILKSETCNPVNGWINTTVTPAPRTPSEVLKEGNGIIFLESTDRMKLPPLVLCAAESAARVYKDRPVAFFMKGLNETNNEEIVKKHFPMLSSLRNIYFFPMNLKELFTGTPLDDWFSKINIQQQSYWTHVSSDGCRLVLVWKYGGIYLDTDVISIRTIPKQNFLAAEHAQSSSNGVFGFSPRHNFTQKCMEGFVKNYNSHAWGNQGPVLFTRVIKTFCDLPKFNENNETLCANITIFKPNRFYPISYPGWKSYYEVWKKLPTFDDSYGLHLWNYMNNGKVKMVPGSNVLAEHLYKTYCPSTYDAILRNEISF
ncbi:alpha-1,4-N-acetylglucosaminyltransferase-like isoform X2 [Engystomops pustulosus]|uniref:alpha-1,4-N-acetylglucosaminyltransferase-like isoform X2 n=1 Tax=Engystomops pustulosus TaxID=76066 RepID=UPI003AFABF84